MCHVSVDFQVLQGPESNGEVFRTLRASDMISNLSHRWFRLLLHYETCGKNQSIGSLRSGFTQNEVPYCTQECSRHLLSKFQLNRRYQNFGSPQKWRSAFTSYPCGGHTHKSISRDRLGAQPILQSWWKNGKWTYHFNFGLNNSIPDIFGVFVSKLSKYKDFAQF